MSKESPKLLELARKKFAPSDLSLAEEKLFRAAESGGMVSALTGDEEQDDPANAVKWQADRVVRGECVVWLCTDREASMLVTHRGIQVQGIRIEGHLDLSHAEIKFLFVILDSAFTGFILLQDTQLPALSLQGCHVKGLEGDRAKIKGSVFLRGRFKAQGEVRLLGATIGGNLVCDGAEFSNPSGKALNIDGAKIEGSVFLRSGFKAQGEVNLVGARIGRNLECSGAQLSNPNGNALIADGANIEVSAFLRDGFKAQGEVRLLGATIGGNLDCRGAQFSNPNGKALSVDGARIEGAASFGNGFKAEGEVRLVGARIARNLECDGAQLSNPNGNALDADGAKIEGSVFLRDGFRAEGEVNLWGATIGGGLAVYGGLEPEKTILNLCSAKVGTLWDEEKNWPTPGDLFLDGFQYTRFDEKSPVDAKSRVKWLCRQPRDRFLPQPYEQLAGVLREMGHERDARLVMIAKNRERARFTRFPRQGWWWYNFFGRIVGYGYAPWRAFAMSVAMIVLGGFLFGAGFSHNLISPTKESAYEKNSNGRFAFVNEKQRFTTDYPVFNAFVYSLESFTPLLKLDQSANWAPNANHGAPVRLWRWQVTTGGLLRWYLWFHIIAGWLLTTLWVGAVTGLVKS
jgi:sRNA-binding regulator protein Hfq